MDSTLSQHDSSPPPYPRQFGWKMRLFLTVFLFCVTYRCFGALLPMAEWREQYGVEYTPRPLPSPVEMRDMRTARIAGQPTSVWEAWMLTADSVWDYWRPWAGPQVRPTLSSTQDKLCWAACWLDSRVDFLERLAGISEQWAMYAPAISTEKIHTRARLFYQDGQQVILRQRAEPEDYTHYTHWPMERIVNHEMEVQDDGTTILAHGYCNLLAHSHAINAQGARLTRIVLFSVIVQLAPPGADAMAHYQEQQRRTATPPGFYEYDAETRHGRLLR